MSQIVSPAVGYRIEGGDEEEHHDAGSSSGKKVIEQPFDLADQDFTYFRDHFKNKADHMTFLCRDPNRPIVISVALDNQAGVYRSVVRTVKGNERVNVTVDKIRSSWWRKMFKMGPSPAEIIRAIDPKLPVGRFKMVVNNPKLIQTISDMEEKQMIKGFKFGILYAREGQTKEDEMFSNVETSPEFEEFLDVIGERIPLDGWPNFRGGLDTKTGTTGRDGLYLKWKNNEVIYHVSTLLPFNPKDKQQLERKRHIGNDIVVIVWQDGTTVYRPTTISSRQVHVVFVVKSVKVAEDPQGTYFRMAVVSKDGVPEFGPPLPKDTIFKKGDDFKEFFYTKLLNAERGSYEAPILGNKLTRTRTALLQDIIQTFG